jgi:hypothetical protein
MGIIIYLFPKKKDKIPVLGKYDIKRGFQLNGYHFKLFK